MVGPAAPPDRSLVHGVRRAHSLQATDRTRRRWPAFDPSAPSIASTRTPATPDRGKRLVHQRRHGDLHRHGQPPLAQRRRAIPLPPAARALPSRPTAPPSPTALATPPCRRREPSRKIDLSDPTATFDASIGSVYFGSVPAAPTCTSIDDVSGPDGCTVSGYGAAVGSHTLTAAAQDAPGRTSTAAQTYAVLPWKLRGFYRPSTWAECGTPSRVAAPFR